ncbi:pentapeptide repeat-containing protein [Okeania sp. SIO2B9]|nr:pentapeptide repeat-containing protein [Okeania sp. SIO2B9]
MMKFLAAITLVISLIYFSLSAPVIAANSEDINHLLQDNWCVSFLWKQCDLSEIDLHETNLNNANLSGANLTGVNFQGADLNGADFSGANLTGANLTGANLSQRWLKTRALPTGERRDENQSILRFLQ